MRGIICFLAVATVPLLSGSTSATPVRIAGVVVDQLTGEPISGIEVRIGVPGAMRTRPATDELGRFEAEFDSVAKEFELTTDSTEVYLPSRTRHVLPAHEVEICLAPKKAPIAGRVIDATSGQPIPFAWVEVGDSVAPCGRVQADAKGDFNIAVPLWTGEGPPAENAMRRDIRFSVNHPGYLPFRKTDVDLSPYASLVTPASLALKIQSYYGELRVEAFRAGTRFPAGGTRMVYGIGPKIIGQVVTDGFGHATVRLPAWRYKDRPLELNVARQDAWVAHLGPVFKPIRANHLSVLAAKREDAAPDGTELPAVAPMIRFSLAPADSQVQQSSFMLGPSPQPPPDEGLEEPTSPDTEAPLPDPGIGDLPA